MELLGMVDFTSWREHADWIKHFKGMDVPLGPIPTASEGSIDNRDIPSSLEVLHREASMNCYYVLWNYKVVDI